MMEGKIVQRSLHILQRQFCLCNQLLLENAEKQRKHKRQPGTQWEDDSQTDILTHAQKPVETDILRQTPASHNRDGRKTQGGEQSMKDNKGYMLLDMASSSHSVPVMEVWCWSKEHLWR